LITRYGAPNRASPELAVEALGFFTESLMSKRLCANLKIRLFFKDDLLKKHRLEAQCAWEDDNLRPREFAVTVDSGLTRHRMLLSLAHEAVHIKQYATGELRYFIRGCACRWRGKPINEDRIPYTELPWEIEAWGRERELLESFLETRKRGRA
jgi:hypothetical protein